MKFNLKEKLQQAKDVSTAALTIAVLTVDDVADRALERLGEFQDAAGRKTSETRDALKQQTEVVKEKTLVNLGKLGDAIEQKATTVSVVAAQFGKTAKSRLNPSAPAAEVAPVAKEAVKKARKRSAKKPAAKTPARG